MPHCAGDANHDNNTDSLDITAFVDCFMQGPGMALGCHCCDMDSSGIVDQTDVDMLADKILGVSDPSPACP